MLINHRTLRQNIYELWIKFELPRTKYLRIMASSWNITQHIYEMSVNPETLYQDTSDILIWLEIAHNNIYETMLSPGAMR